MEVLDCIYCKNYSKKPSELFLDNIIIIETAKYTKIGDGIAYSIPLKYCPNCGRKLK